MPFDKPAALIVVMDAKACVMPQFCNMGNAMVAFEVFCAFRESVSIAVNVVYADIKDWAAMEMSELGVDT